MQTFAAGIRIINYSYVLLLLIKSIIFLCINCLIFSSYFLLQIPFRRLLNRTAIRVSVLARTTSIMVREFIHILYVYYTAYRHWCYSIGWSNEHVPQMIMRNTSVSLRDVHLGFLKINSNFDKQPGEFIQRVTYVIRRVDVTERVVIMRRYIHACICSHRCFRRISADSISLPLKNILFKRLSVWCFRLKQQLTLVLTKNRLTRIFF